MSISKQWRKDLQKAQARGEAIEKAAWSLGLEALSFELVVGAQHAGGTELRHFAFGDSREVFGAKVSEVTSLLGTPPNAVKADVVSWNPNTPPDLRACWELPWPGDTERRFRITVDSYHAKGCKLVGTAPPVPVYAEAPPAKHDDPVRLHPECEHALKDLEQ